MYRFPTPPIVRMFHGYFYCGVQASDGVWTYRAWDLDVTTVVYEEAGMDDKAIRTNLIAALTAANLKRSETRARDLLLAARGKLPISGAPGQDGNKSE